MIAPSRLSLLALLLVLAACRGGESSDPESPADAGVEIRLTGTTPYAPGCDTATPNGTLYVGTEIEPQIAVNPSNPDHLALTFQQDRWSDGGSRGVRSAASFDGGRTWTLSSATFSRCTGGSAANGGDYERASNPWISVAPDGTVYQIAIAMSGHSQAIGSTSAVLVSRSRDGGLSWEPPVTLIRDGGNPFNDKESITADPTDSRYAYAVWDRLEDVHGPTLMSRTTDGGLSWEPARVIFDPGPGNMTINGQIVVLPDGTLVCGLSVLILSGHRIAGVIPMVVRSTDKGVTWSTPVGVATAFPTGVIDPERRIPVRTSAFLGSIAAGRNGQLVFVWQDSRFATERRDGVALSRSFDGGLTWTRPVQVNRVPEVQAFSPIVSIRDDGTIGVSYFDLRSNTAEPSLLVDYWLAETKDGETWRESRIAPTFDLSIAPNANGLFLGDYMGLVSRGATFVIAYASTTGDLMNRTDVLVRLGPMPEATAAAAAATWRVAPPAGDFSPTPERAKAFSEAAASMLEQRRMPASGPSDPLR